MVVSPRHLTPLHIEQPARAASHAGAVCFFAPREGGAHMAVPASEETRQPTIRDRRWTRRFCMTSVLYGHVFNGFHEESGRMATCV
jgi:hypothetical protein